MRAMAPAKIILSGEHAVVYGKPALVTAVDRFASADVTANDDSTIFFHLEDFNEKASATLDDLRDVHRHLSQRYQAFLDGSLEISAVVQRPSDLFAFLFISFIDFYHLQLDRGLRISLRSDIPVGSGMGSSAATVLSVLRAMTGFFNLRFDGRQSFALALDAEKLQHGRPSGVDPYISLNGGFARFQNQQAVNLPIPELPFYLINTGKPASSTGECVSHVAAFFGDSPIWDDFEAVTQAMQQALVKNDLGEIQRRVRENHQMLVTIGVTPVRVQQFIAEIEKNGAAKIAGAGSIRGDGGGMVTVFSEKNPQKVAEKYGFVLMPVKGEPLGARLL